MCRAENVEDYGRTVRSDDSNSTPPARAFCSSPLHKGPRWLLSVYFYRHPKHRNGLQSQCITCQKMRTAAKYQSTEQLKKRSERSREYKAFKRRENGVKVRRLKKPGGRYGEGRALTKTGLFFDRAKLLRYLDKRTEVEAERKRGKEYLNGIPLEDTDLSYIRHVRDGSIESVSYDRIDALATRYDLDMWEIEEKCLLSARPASA